MSRFHDRDPAPERIDRFRGDYAFLSNFHRAPFQWRGKDWPSAEAAFAASKTRDERERECIRNAPTPADGGPSCVSREILERLDATDADPTPSTHA